MTNFAKMSAAMVIASIGIACATTTVNAAPVALDPAPAAQDVATTPIATTGSALTDILTAPILFPLGFIAFALCAASADPDHCPAYLLYGAAATASGVHN
ncbi:hypothetical protein [Nocardia sp. NBC_01327]|uniref:hypothetical protein n=1 Tax=Nocardia sp. NBC_01327 TaxID=2903593 RepID=UPI002E0DD68F|nr:hypothetical protein OG326_33815 [Nocardia sp. NBC_01327]